MEKPKSCDEVGRERGGGGEGSKGEDGGVGAEEGSWDLGGSPRMEGKLKEEVGTCLSKIPSLHAHTTFRQGS